MGLKLLNTWRKQKSIYIFKTIMLSVFLIIYTANRSASQEITVIYGNREHITSSKILTIWSYSESAVSISHIDTNLSKVRFNIIFLIIIRFHRRYPLQNILAKMLYEFLIFPLRPACYSLLVLIHLTSQTAFGEEYQSWSSSQCSSFSH
jgi:hypothetical protein